jgi:hypothetical protein
MLLFFAALGLLYTYPQTQTFSYKTIPCCNFLFAANYFRFCFYFAYLFNKKRNVNCIYTLRGLGIPIRKINKSPRLHMFSVRFTY